MKEQPTSPAQAKITKYYVSQVMANSVVSRLEIPWVNTIQLLTSAGLAMVDWAERKALTKIREEVQIQRGWNNTGQEQRLARVVGLDCAVARLRPDVEGCVWEIRLRRSGGEVSDKNV